MLHGRAHGVLDAAAVEAANGLELVERDHDLPLAQLVQPLRQREDVGGQPGDVAVGADGRELHRHAHGAGESASSRSSGRAAPMASRSHARAFSRPVCMASSARV